MLDFPTNNEATVKQDRWSALPFFLLMFSAGLPLTYKLEAARPMTVADTAELTLAATASQNTANSLFFVVFISALYLMAAWNIFRKPKTVIALVCRQWPTLLLMLFIAASAFWSYTPEKVLINTVHNIGIMLIAIGVALRYRHDPWLLTEHLGIVVGANMLLQLGAVFIMPSLSIDWQGRWHGFAPHPNTLGALSFVVLWCNAAVLLFKRSRYYFLHFIFVISAVVAMVGANSMTTLMCSTFALLLMFMIQKMRQSKRQHRLVLPVLSLSLGIPIVAIVATKLVSIDTLLNFFGRDSQLTGRISLWEIAFKAISEQLFFGWSFDDHVHLVRVSNMSFPNFHNGILDLAVSGGLVAVLLFFFILISMLRDYFKTSRVGNNIVPFSLSFLLPYMIYNFTEATLVSPRSQMWIIFLALVFLGACRDRSRAHPDQHGFDGLAIKDEFVESKFPA